MSILNHIFGIQVAAAQVSNSVNQVGQETGNEFTKLVANFLAAIPLWIAAIFVAILSYIVAILVKRSIENKMAEKGIEEEHKEIQIVAGRSAYFIVLVIGITISLSIVGIDLKPIVAAGAFGLGFALQDIIMNTISGMLILASRHYTIGDVIAVDGIVGRIMEIQTRATIIKAFDGTKVIVPNANLFKNVVVSKTSNPFRKLSFVMGVGYEADLKQVMDLTLAVVKTIPHVLASPKPSVIFYEWGDYSVNFRINVWIDSKGGKMIKVKNQVMMELNKAYNDSGLDIPYPIQTVYMDKADEAEIKQEEINERIAKIKSQLANRVVKPNAPVVAAPIVAAAVPVAAPAQIENTVPAPVIESAPAPQPAAAPLDVAPVQPTVAPTPEATPAPNPASLPSAIETTANSPGQSWLEKALSAQVNQPAAPTAPVENAPAVQPTAASTPVQSTQPMETTAPAPVESAPAPAVTSAPTPSWLNTPNTQPNA